MRCSVKTIQEIVKEIKYNYEVDYKLLLKL